MVDTIKGMQSNGDSAGSGESAPAPSFIQNQLPAETIAVLYCCHHAFQNVRYVASFAVMALSPIAKFAIVSGVLYGSTSTTATSDTVT